MKRMIAAQIIALVVAASPLPAADVGFDINIRGGIPVPTPPPIPVPRLPRIEIPEPPVFLAPSSLGFYVGVGTPYDIFMVGSQYYLFQDNIWYRAPHYKGPWVSVPYRRLPPGLRKHKFERIRHLRDEEYQHYREDEDRYRGRHFRPDREWKEQRKAEHEEWKQEKRWEKEERKEHRHRNHDD